MQKVQILMSTYNGEMYLAEQLDSIVGQTWQNTELLIRDDGSGDGTVGILKKYEEKYKNIKIIRGENTGVSRSFFILLEQSEADYIAFSDQDDIWFPDKVETAVRSLEGIEIPALYACGKILVGADGNVISDKKEEKTPSFGNALVENICTGCTIVLNRKMADLVKRHIPENAVLHDWWCYLLAAYAGTVIFDSNPHIYYRQHGNNAVGASSTVGDKIKFNVRYILNNRGKLRAQLREFADAYHIDGEKDRLLQRVLKAEKFPQCIAIAFCTGIKRQSVPDEIIMRILFIFCLML